MRKVIVAAAVLLGAGVAAARGEEGTTASGAKEGRTLREAIRPAPKVAALEDPKYILWCPCVIKVGEVYHLFASRWPAEHGMAGWTKYSEVIRASSTNLLGPYKFEGVVLTKRPEKWDNTRVHNVKVVKAGGKFVLYHIDTANETGYASADSVEGPWTRYDKAAMKVSNPAPLVRADGSVYVLGRLKVGDVNRAIAFTAPRWDGEYSVLAGGENLLPGGAELEDPTIWWANGRYNVVLNDWKGKATGVSKAGAQYFSTDGVKYELVSKEPVFTKTVTFEDGTEEAFARRERPFVYVEDGVVLGLFTACLPKDGPARIVGQAVDRYVPGNK